MSIKAVTVLKLFLAVVLLIGSEPGLLCATEEKSLVPELPAPEIESLQPQCYNKEFILKNKPVGYSGVTRYWEYGVFGDEWQAVGEFGSFLSNIESILQELYPCSVQCETCDAGKISTAISGTNYQFMNKYYMLYANLDANKSGLADEMRVGIQDQYQDYLSNEERAYLSSFFMPAAIQATGWIPAYMPIVANWLNLGSTTEDQVPFNASSFITSGSDIVILAFRVRLESGPYSRVQLTNIKPRPPSFKPVTSKTCPSTNTGEISITEIQGLVTGNNYIGYAILGEAGDRITFTGTGCTFPYKYGAGTYLIKLAYNDDRLGGCSDIVPVTVESHPVLKFTFTPHDASCPEKADGSVSVELETSAGGHNFKLNNTNITTKTGTFYNLDNGSYILEVTDLCNISAIGQSVSISEPSPVNITSISKLDPTCNSSPNGSVQVNASGGKPGNTTFSYQLFKDGSVINSGTGYPEWSVSGLSGGNYSVSVSAGGCAPTVATAPSLSYVQPVNFSATATAVDCFGNNTGSISVTPSGGINSYRYLIDNVIRDQPFGSLNAGTYIVTLQTTVPGCNDNKTEYVTVGTAPKIAISFPETVSPSCFEGTNGKISAEVTGGIGSYRYAWTSNVMNIPYNSGTITGLQAGNYTLSVTDSKNCLVSNGTSLTDPPDLTVLSALPTDATCFGGKGSISIMASGGNGGYIYSCSDDYGRVFTDPGSVNAGEYYVHVKDKNGCLGDYSETVLVTEPDSPLELSWDSPGFNGFNISCQGEATGLINVDASGGNGFGNDGYEYEGYVYSLSGSPFQSVGSFTGLHAGSFIIAVKDERGCVSQKTITLTEPAPLSLTLVSSSPVRCFGASTGEIIVSASGGIVNTYKYSLDGVATLSPGTFTNLNAGTYDIKVSDLNGCSQIFPAVVESLNPPINIIAMGKNVRCSGEGNGEINTAVSGGAGGFTYEWEKKSGAGWLALEGNSGARTTLVPGIYRVKVTDSENCFQYETSEITEPQLLRVTGVTTSDIVCSGEKGSIGIEASGGTAAFTYYCTAANDEVFQSALPHLQLPAGSYSASVKDANGCVAVHTSIQEISSPASALDFTASLSSYHGYSVSCNGKSDGQISVEASGGNGEGYSGYTYSLTNGPSQPVNIFSGLAAGSYTMKVADARGCTIQKNVVLTQPEQVTMDLRRVSPVKCYGASTGEIEVLTSGGVQDYSYKVNGVPAASTGLFKNLSAGNYIVETSDLNGCSFNLTALIEHKNPPISTLLTALKVKCSGESNGEIKAEITGGSGGFTYSWDRKNETGWQPYEAQGTNISNLKAGLYRINSEDSDNCRSSGIVEITEPKALVIRNVNVKDAICFGDKGSFEIEAEGGNDGYRYQYSPNNNRFIYNEYASSDPLPSGVYALRVIDSEGCTYEHPAEFIITSPVTELSIGTELSAYGNFNVSCHGNNDGRITVMASGGNGWGYTGYTYQLSGKPFQDNNAFTGLQAGTYDLAVIDGRGCKLTKQVTLLQPESEMTLRASVIKRPVCIYGTDGAISLTATGGTLPLEYSVNNLSYTASADFTGLPVNDYSFRVRDRNGCTQTFDTALVSVISRMNLSGDVTDVKCFGGNTGSVKVHVAGGAAPFTYSWKGISSAESIVASLLKGSYTVLVTDSAGCSSEKMFSVSEPEKPLSLSAVSSPACVGLKDGLIEATASGGTPPYRFAVDSDRDFPLPSSFNVYSGNHRVYASDLNDCIAATPVFVNVRNTMPNINFMLASSRYELDTLVVVDVSVPPPDKVTWEFSEDANVISTDHNTAKVKYNAAGLYPVRMTGLFGTCAYSLEKILNIAPFDPDVIGDGSKKEGIKSLKISPNPNDGLFRLDLELFTKQQVTVKIYDISSRILYNEAYPPDIVFIKEINLKGSVMPGTCVLLVTCENDARSAVFVISE